MGRDNARDKGGGTFMVSKGSLLDMMGRDSNGTTQCDAMGRGTDQCNGMAMKK
jgi:hypothetical protein